MGKLIAKRYRTPVMAYLADHTYVECSEGKGWSCWGGKTGGQYLNSGTGSTKRADMIANLDERAGITRYLIDGVCHQAANRILAPAGILVSEARGYRLSLAIFGTYGRSTFNMHANVTGDHQACTAKAPAMAPKDGGPVGSSDYSMRAIDRALVRSNKAYEARFQFETPTPLDSLNLNVQRYMRDVGILLGGKLSHPSLAGLKDAKSIMELRLQEMDAALVAGHVQPAEFVSEFDRFSDQFQDAAANALSKRLYEDLFKADRDERIRLTDPVAVDQAFGPGTFLRANSLPPM